jgi:EAL domain-containing protein (putative c-di-GMP-specific phosphodiesterase class I)/GGDEF domain-containing protein
VHAEDDLPWLVLARAAWPLLVVDSAERLCFANPEARSWLRESGLPWHGIENGQRIGVLPEDADVLVLDPNDGHRLVQRRSGARALQPAGLLDAAGLIFRLERALQTALQLGQVLSVSQFSLALYHEIESLYGRNEAGALLDRISERVVSQLRRGEFAGHLGNGQLVVVSLAQPTAEACMRATEYWVRTLAQPLRVGRGEHAHRVTGGLAIAPQHGRTAAELLDHAAAAAFTAARQHRGAVWAFSEAMARQMQDDMLLESACASALQQDEFHLVFQPKVRLREGHACLDGVEALLRWHSPSLGNVSPARFIPIAERAGFMPDLGRLVVEKACAQIVRWREGGWEAPVVAVNVSGHEFNQSDFRGQFRRTLERFDVPPSALQIEITESALLQDVDHAIHVLRSLKSDGVGLAIDDFGTGYSSLGYLRRFPADLIKIDRSFVVDAEQDTSARAVLSSIVQLAQSLAMDVVAEGVETEAQRDTLLSLGCSCFQGFLFGRPVPALELEAAWVRDEVPDARGG